MTQVKGAPFKALKVDDVPNEEAIINIFNDMNKMVNQRIKKMMEQRIKQKTMIRNHYFKRKKRL